jgi:hypothetical protein
VSVRNPCTPLKTCDCIRDGRVVAAGYPFYLVDIFARNSALAETGDDVPDIFDIGRQSGAWIDDGIGQGCDDLPVWVSDLDVPSLIICPFPFDRVERFALACLCCVSADEIFGNFVEHTPHFAAWLPDDIGCSAVTAAAEYIKGEFVVVDGFRDADEFRIAFEPVVLVDLRGQAI